MDGSASADVFVFESFRLDRGGLFRLGQAGTAEPVALGSRALDLLRLFVERQGQLVSKDEMIEAVWQGMAVEEGNLTVQVSALRRALDQGRRDSCIQTVIGRGYRFTPQVTHVEPAAQRTISLASNSPRLSIVVLPFADLGGDPTQQYFADALTDDLTTDLSRIADLLVISRNTAFTYRDKPADTRQIGRELRVRYALEGSVRRLGNHIRVNAQLVDAETDTHLWAERFDRDVEDLFALQDEVTSRIAIALNTELMAAEAARPTEHPDALDYMLRARAILLQPPTRDNCAAAISLFERALAFDPSSVEAQSRLANALVDRVINDMTASWAADMARAEKLVSEALAGSPRKALVHFVKGLLLRAQHRPEEAIPEFETVIALDRNWLSAYASVSSCKLLIGSIDEVIPLVEKLLLLSPRDRSASVWNYWIGRVHLLKSRTDEAILWFEKARRANPALAFVHTYLASAYALNGEAEHAAAELAGARRLSADGRYSSIQRLKATQYFGVPKVRDLFEATYFAGLRKAGMPET